MLFALDIDGERAAAALAQGLAVERGVALQRRKIRQAEVFVPKVRQRADQDDVGVQAMGDRVASSPEVGQAGERPAQDIGPQRQRLAVELDVEAGEFGNHQRIGQCVEEGGVDRRGPPAMVRQPDLDLEPHDIVGLDRFAATVKLKQRRGLGS